MNENSIITVLKPCK